MNLQTLTEENHLKAIYQISTEDAENKGASTNAIAERLQTKPSSVTDMLKKLSDKKLINYKKYQGVTLTRSGKKIAIQVLRKHRLWEFFLVEKLHFKWDEVHEIAEQLEHIQSEELINRLDKYLSYPRFDPHGDPIPDINGKVAKSKLVKLSELEVSEQARVISVSNQGDSASFLQYLEQHHIIPGCSIKIKNTYDFDHSLSISVNKRTEIHISNEVAKNILVSII